jgi:thioester reductase-like protein
MSLSSKNISGLSSEEKRKFLLEMLKKKVKKPQSHPSPNQDWMETSNFFTINVTDLNAETALDPAIRAGSEFVEPLAEPAHIFLTGATGFLGAFLLHELLLQTRADIHCLVRCSNVEEGKSRLLKNLDSYAPGNGHDHSRIFPIQGDLSQPLLGLSTRKFQALARKIECIYHCGAFVNWIFPYTRLKPINVSGTQEVLRLAGKGRVKPMHFISSISVFPLVTESGSKVLREQDSLDHEGILYGGYTQSKWVAEKLVSVARSRGLPVVIYRPGLITGHSQTGSWNTKDITCTIIKSWIELGCAPELDAATDMTPVDYVSKAIVHLSRQPHSVGKVFHLANQHPVHVMDMVAWIRSYGYPLNLLPYAKWREELTLLSKHSKANGAASLAPLFSLKLSENDPREKLHNEDAVDGLVSIILAQFASSSVKVDCRNALAGLDGSSIECPPIDANLFEGYLSYFIQNGFLQASQVRRTD